MIRVFLGTKAQYIKTAPLLRLMDHRRIPYRLIDSGQHAQLSVGLREELGVRAPDVVMGGETNIDSVTQALWWSAKLGARVFNARALRRDVFGAEPGIVVVHGDTPSTFLSTLLARRAGFPVAHLEAGLRSHRLFDPFPEELIRIAVMHASSVLFAPDDVAVANLAALKVRGDVVPIAANTVVEAVTHALGDDPAPPGSGPAVITMHRVENLKRPARVTGFERLATEAASRGPVRFVVHGPTIEVMEKNGALDRLRTRGVEVVPLVPHGEFVAMIHAAPYVVTDGGSIQEECALLGVPTLLWRQRSERPDGIGRNVVVSRHDPRIVRAFLDEPSRHRVPPTVPDVAPSEQILEELLRRDV